MKSMKVKTTEGKKTPVVLVCKNMHLDFEDLILSNVSADIDS